MSEYQLEIKQIVDYPRCRIYRKFIQALINDPGIRTNGCSGLFHFTVLCSYANFRTSYRRIDGLSYTIYPGEWICRISEAMSFTRLKSRKQLIRTLDRLQELNLIQYSLLGHGHVLKYKIKGWRRHNTVLDYNCPCQKETGFFFLPVSIATELVGAERCSEMDAILDLWLNAVYNDPQVYGSLEGPVAYFRNGSGMPLVSYAELSQRWGMSKASVGRLLKKLSDRGYISQFTFPGRHGTAIYLRNYLSTMFQISDVLVDKEEVAMSLNIKIQVPDQADTLCSDRESCVANTPVIVSKPMLDLIAEKVLKLLEIQGISCANCEKSKYKLYPLSGDCQSISEADCSKIPKFLRMELFCRGSVPLYSFELTIQPSNTVGGNAYE